MHFLKAKPYTSNFTRCLKYSQCQHLTTYFINTDAATSWENWNSGGTVFPTLSIRQIRHWVESSSSHGVGQVLPQSIIPEGLLHYFTRLHREVLHLTPSSSHTKGFPMYFFCMTQLHKIYDLETEPVPWKLLEGFLLHNME